MQKRTKKKKKAGVSANQTQKPGRIKKRFSIFAISETDPESDGDKKSVSVREMKEGGNGK